VVRRALPMTPSPMSRGLAVLVVLAIVVIAATACTSYKAPAKDANAGGGGMYRAVDSTGAH